MSTFITPVSNPNTIVADGATVDITNWLANFNTIYNYVNTDLVSQFNLMNYAGDLITNNGSAISVLTTNGVTDGYVLSKNASAANGIQWISPPGLPTTTEGDLIYYHSGSNARLAIGTNGQVLTSNGTDPTWQNPAAFPSGIIAMWGGAVSAIPSGWLLCDGTSGTPNLQGLFIVGAGATSPGATGGMGLINPGGPYGDNSAGAGLGPSETFNTGPPSTTGFLNNGTGTTIQYPDRLHTHTATITVTPKYYALCYIQKT